MKGMAEMRVFKTSTLAVLGLSAFLLLTLATPAFAQRPAYLHALSDLREARAALQSASNPAFAGVRDRALSEIADAIRELDAAVSAEGRNPHQTPPPAYAGSDDRPMRQALVLLNKARGDVAAGTDDTGHQGLQRRALGHIENALDILNRSLHR